MKGERLLDLPNDVIWIILLMTIRQNIHNFNNGVIEDKYGCSFGCKHGVVAQIGLSHLKWTCKKIRHILQINSTFYIDRTYPDADFRSRYHLRGIKCECVPKIY